MVKIGSRVGAIRDANKNVVNLYGYGVYVGNEVPPKGVSIFGIELNEIGRRNPKIVLDSGEIIWGCQCWWGSEESVKRAIGNRKVNIVSIS